MRNVNVNIMNNIKIASLNVRGMQGGLKRRKVFTYLKDSNCDIFLLQETHSTKNTAKCWTSEWGSKAIYSHGVSNSRGVCILFRKDQWKVTEIVRDINGRYIVCKLTIGEDSYGIVNVYGFADKDHPELFHEISTTMQSIKCDYWITGGDFNVTLDNELDRYGSSVNPKPNATISVLNLIEEFDLIDIWRNNHPYDKKYTWFKRKPRLACSRLDFLLISECLANKTNKTEILLCTVSDHSMVTVEIETDMTKRGPGVWRFNNNHLKNDYFVEQMKQKINQTKRVHDYMDAFTLWEYIKTESANFAKQFSKKQARQEKIYRCNLYKTLELLQNDVIVEGKCDDQLETSIRRVETAINSSLENDAKKSAFLCRARYVKDGEKNSKYFFGRGKRKFCEQNDVQNT